MFSAMRRWWFLNVAYPFAAWLFVHRLGQMSQRYHQLTQATEKAAFLTEQFGRQWVEVLQEHESQLRIDTQQAFERDVK